MNTRLGLLAATLVLALAFAGAASPTGASTGFPPPSATVCPQSLDPRTTTDKRTDAAATCYFLPEVYFTPSSGTVAVNQTFTFTLEVRYAEYGCTKSGAWSGSITTDSSGHYGPQSVTVGPFASAGTYTFALSCGGLGGTTAGSTTLTVTAPGGGGSGSGGGAGCTENLTSQLYATFVSQSGVPASVTAGQTFTASITFQNTGSCTWTAANGYRLGSQNPENNATWGTSRLYLAASDAIAPGQSKTFSFTAVAPATPGSYGWGWRMVREGINWLGTPTNGSFTTIAVSAPVPGPTVSLTASPTVIGSGGSSVLTWSSTNTTSCSAPWTSSSATSGSQAVSPSAATTYSISCTGAGGSASATASVDVDTSISDYAIQDQYGSGDPVLGVDNLVFDSATGTTCRWAHATITWRNLAMVWLWRYHEDIKWCWRNIVHITSIFRNRWPESNSFLGYTPWGFDGHKSNTCNTENCSDMAVGQPASAVIGTGGSFTACALKIALCHTKSPYIAITIRAGGSASVYKMAW